MSALKLVTLQSPTPLNKNKFWQELNKRLGVSLNLINTPSSGYSAKLATTIAGGDIPDLVQLSLSGGASPDNMAKVLESDFEDLTPFLGGDAVKPYPNLAGLPTVNWRSGVFDGRLYTVPHPQALVLGDYRVRQDILDTLGIDLAVSDGKEFLALCKSITDPRKNRWAISSVGFAMWFVKPMVGSPNGWKLENGKFTSQYETPEFSQAMDIVRGMWKDGYLYPDSLSSFSPVELFNGGKIVLDYSAYSNWGQWLTAGSVHNPSYKIGGITLPKWDGDRQAGHYLGPGSSYMTGVKKGSAARVGDLLRVLDYFASPFGTEEYLFNHYGIAGRDYSLHGSDPVETSVGVGECQAIYTDFIAAPTSVLYLPGQTELMKEHYEYLSELMKVVVPLPTTGLYSATSAGKGPSIEQKIGELANDITLGRKPLSAWAAGVKAWRAGGGDEIRSEYEAAYAHQINGG